MKNDTFEKYKVITEYFKQHHDAKVVDLKKQFYLSEATIRRILTALEEKGLIRRYHGGATLIDPESLSSIKQRSINHLEEKQAIGKLAATYVEDGMTLIMTGGTTVEAMCPFISNKRITVITNSLTVVNKLAWKANIQIILLGGVLNATEMEVRGALTEHSISRLRADKMFMSTSGVHPVHGIMTDDPNSVGTYARCSSVSDLTYVLADSSKFTHSTGTTVLFHMTEISQVITDTGIPSDIRKRYESAGIKIYTAETVKSSLQEV